MPSFFRWMLRRNMTTAECQISVPKGRYLVFTLPSFQIPTMKTQDLNTKIITKKPKNVRNCESWVSDGWSQRALRKLLRVSPARLRSLIGTGMLRVRDPRVTTSSLLTLCSRNGLSLDHYALERITAVLSKHDACPWERAADLLGIAVEQLQKFICKGKLKVLDPFVTDRSFEEFCRKHGDQINMSGHSEVACERILCFTGQQ